MYSVREGDEATTSGEDSTLATPTEAPDARTDNQGQEVVSDTHSPTGGDREELVEEAMEEDVGTETVDVDMAKQGSKRDSKEDKLMSTAIPMEGPVADKKSVCDLDVDEQRERSIGEAAHGPSSVKGEEEQEASDSVAEIDDGDWADDDHEMETSHETGQLQDEYTAAIKITKQRQRAAHKKEKAAATGRSPTARGKQSRSMVKKSAHMGEHAEKAEPRGRQDSSPLRRQQKKGGRRSPARPNEEQTNTGSLEGQLIQNWMGPMESPEILLRSRLVHYHQRD
jgi:hypothetical protein